MLIVFSRLAAETSAFTYTVKERDTLSGIARQFNVTIEDIMEINNLKDPDKIRAGLELIIPLFHVIVKGDTLYALAKKYAISLDELCRLNGLTQDSVLKIGERLVVPSKIPENNDTVANPSVLPTTAGQESNEQLWPHDGTRSPLDGTTKGIKIEGNIGDAIRSVSDGIVDFIGSQRGWGKYIVVRSNETFFLYCGFDEIFVDVNQSVSISEELGTLGFNTLDNGALVKFFVIRNGKSLDPSTERLN